MLNKSLLKKKMIELKLFPITIVNELGLNSVKEISYLEDGVITPTEEQIEKMCELFQIKREELFAKKESKTRVIAIFNHKGGIAKTVTTVNLASTFASMGKKILVIDFDGQANATKTLGINVDKKKNVYTFVNPDSNYYGNFEECIIPTAVENVDIISGVDSNDDLNRVLMNTTNVEKKFNELITPIIELDKYDYVLIDNSTGRTTALRVALHNCDYALTPLKADDQYSMDGLNGLFEALDEALAVNLKLKNLMIFRSLYDKRNKSLLEAFRSTIEEHYGKYLLDSVIRIDINIGKSNVQRLPINKTFPTSKATIDFIELANEIERCIQKTEGKR